jgi:hypothetical protein
MAPFTQAKRYDASRTATPSGIERKMLSQSILPVCKALLLLVGIAVHPRRETLLLFIGGFPEFLKG